MLALRPKDWLIDKLSRTTTSGEIIREIDGFRFIAISSVVFHHILAIFLESRYHLEMPPEGWQGLQKTHKLVWLLSPTWFGVQLFFVISGFVLALPFARHHLLGGSAPSLKSYYLRRLTRIEPPYFIALLVYMLLLCVGDTNWHARLPNFFASFFYIHNLVYGEMSRIGSIFWSLEVEIQFYIMAPLFALLFSIKKPGLRRGALISLIALWGYVFSQWGGLFSTRVSLSLLANLQYFLAGFLLVEIYFANDWLASHKSYFWDAIAMLLPAALDITMLKYWSWSWLLPFGIVLLYVSLFLGRIGNRLITHPVVYLIGGMCYTIYLYHVLVILYAGRPFTFLVSSPQHPLLLSLCLQTLLLGPIIVVVCGVLFYFFEKPFMQLRVRA